MNGMPTIFVNIAPYDLGPMAHCDHRLFILMDDPRWTPELQTGSLHPCLPWTDWVVCGCI